MGPYILYERHKTKLPQPFSFIFSVMGICAHRPLPYNLNYFGYFIVVGYKGGLIYIQREISTLNGF